MIGKCICGAVQFELSGVVPNFYQCHCALCRKQSGTASNTATFIRENNFAWISGQNSITSFVKDTGFTSAFCTKCGSVVPNKLRDTGKYWVPAGALEGADSHQIVADICTSSKAGWDPLATATNQFSEMPEFDTLEKVLQQAKR